MEILFFSNDICFEHQPSGNHPERPDRLSAVLDGLKRARMGSTITKLSAEAVDENIVLQVHDQELISELKRISEQGGGIVDADTRMSTASWKAALVAAGAGLQAITNYKTEPPPAFAQYVHPVTTQQYPNRFCLNNVAVTAKKLRNQERKFLLLTTTPIMEMEPKTSSIPILTFYSYLSSDASLPLDWSG